MLRNSAMLLFFLLVCADGAFTQHDPWVEVRSSHFVVNSNGGQEQARGIAAQLERMRAVLQDSFPNARVDSPLPIVVIAVKTQKEFSLLEPDEFLTEGHLELAGAFVRSPVKNYILLRLDGQEGHPFAPVYHEYTHFVLSRTQPWLPLWMNEGWAQFYENSDIKEDGVDVGQPSARRLTLLRRTPLLSLTTLLMVDRDSPYYHQQDKGAVFYSQSWALIHLLRTKDLQGKTDRLGDYAKLVSRNVDPVTAAAQAFGDLERLQKELQRYVAQMFFTHLRLPGVREVDESQFKTRALTSTQAKAVRADFLASSRQEKDARPLLEEVLKEDPNSVSARESLGVLALQNQNFKSAKKWFGEARKLEPQNDLIQVYYAAAAVRESVVAGEAETIESGLRTALKSNPTFAPAYDTLAAFYAQQRKNLEEARKLSLKAIDLEPRNPEFHITLAYVLAQTDRTNDALGILQKTFKLAENPQQVESIQTRIDSLKRYSSNRYRYFESEDEFRRVKKEAEQALAEEEAELAAEQTRPGGPQRSFVGTLTKVRCVGPGILKMKVVSKSNTLALNSFNFYDIQYSGPAYPMSQKVDPCQDLEGKQAKIEYFEGLDGKDGEIISIELRK